MSRAPPQRLPVDAVVASPSQLPNLFGSSYKRQKTSTHPPFPVSDHDSDNEPIHPFYLPATARLSPKRQVLQAKVRRLVRKQHMDEGQEETDGNSDRETHKHHSQQQTKTTAAPARTQPSASVQSADAQQRTNQQKPRAQCAQSSATADGGGDMTAEITPAQARLRRTRYSPPRTARSAQPPTYSAAMRPQPASPTRLLSPSSSSDSSFSCPSTSSLSSPLSPQRLLSEWVDRRIAIKQRSERKEEQRWKAGIQRQLAQLLQQTTTLQAAGWSKQQSANREERTRERRVEQLEERLERMADGWEKSQQQRNSETSERRRRAMQRALQRQLSGSGGSSSDVRRTQRFNKREEGRRHKKGDGVGEPTTRVQKSSATEAPLDGWVRSENQLIWLLQQTDVASER